MAIFPSDGNAFDSGVFLWAERASGKHIIPKFQIDATSATPSMPFFRNIC
jgi:hypothetical protein